MPRKDLLARDRMWRLASQDSSDLVQYCLVITESETKFMAQGCKPSRNPSSAQFVDGQASIPGHSSPFHLHSRCSLARMPAQ